MCGGTRPISPPAAGASCAHVRVQLQRLPASPRSPAVSALDRDSSAFSALERALASSPFFQWRTEDGHRCSEFHELLLPGRALAALLEEDTAASRDALREWLPPPNELVRTAQLSTLFEGMAMGAAHPSLACARLHATRLAAWDAAATGEQQADAAYTPPNAASSHAYSCCPSVCCPPPRAVAEAVLAVSPFNIVNRVDALRLLAQCRAATGQRQAARDALEAAAEEAHRAGYGWLHMVACRDLLECADDKLAARKRLDDALLCLP